MRPNSCYCNDPFIAHCALDMGGTDCKVTNTAWRLVGKGSDHAVGKRMELIDL